MCKRLLFAMVAVAALTLFTGIARADQTFTTDMGATDAAGDPVSATADFSYNSTTDTWTLTLTNTGTTDNAGQLLTDLFFSVSSGTPTLGSQTGDLITIDSSGAVTDLGTQTLGWGFGSATVNSTSGFEVCVICQGGPSASATPSEGIVGPGPYTSANSSIAGNDPHDPYVNQTATFTFTGLGPDAVFSNVIFSFGTTPGDNVSAPEPSSISMLGMGVLALMGLLFVRRKMTV